MKFEDIKIGQEVIIVMMEWNSKTIFFQEFESRLGTIGTVVRAECGLAEVRFSDGAAFWAGSDWIESAPMLAIYPEIVAKNSWRTNSGKIPSTQTSMVGSEIVRGIAPSYDDANATYINSYGVELVWHYDEWIPNPDIYVIAKEDIAPSELVRIDLSAMTIEKAKPRAILPWDDSPAPEIDYLKINRDFS